MKLQKLKLKQCYIEILINKIWKILDEKTNKLSYMLPDN